jgi:hypothetical protein
LQSFNAAAAPTEEVEERGKLLWAVFPKKPVAAAHKDEVTAATLGVVAMSTEARAVAAPTISAEDDVASRRQPIARLPSPEQTETLAAVASALADDAAVEHFIEKRAEKKAKA